MSLGYGLLRETSSRFGTCVALSVCQRTVPAVIASSGSELAVTKEMLTDTTVVLNSCLFVRMSALLAHRCIERLDSDRFYDGFEGEAWTALPHSLLTQVNCNCTV